MPTTGPSHASVASLHPCTIYLISRLPITLCIYASTGYYCSGLIEFTVQLSPTLGLAILLESCDGHTSFVHNGHHLITLLNYVKPVSLPVVPLDIVSLAVCFLTTANY